MQYRYTIFAITPRMMNNGASIDTKELPPHMYNPTTANVIIDGQAIAIEMTCQNPGTVNDNHPALLPMNNIIVRPIPIPSEYNP